MRSPLQFILTLSLIFAWQAEVSSSRADTRCLLQSLKQAFSRSSEAQKLGSTPLLFEEDFNPGDRANEFYASNEFDWHLAPADHTETDVLIGFGTNSAWDLAVRSRAKALVIGDWKKEVLEVQELLLKPMILNSESPAEFLCHLNRLPYLPQLKHASLEQTFQYMDYARHVVTLAERERGLAALLEKVRKDSRLSATHYEASKKFYRDMIHWDPETQPHQFGPIISRHIRRVADMAGFFEDRYRPSRLLAQGAKLAQLKDPYFSFLSSGEAFQHLKGLMDGHLYYVKSSYENPEIYAAVKRLADQKDYRKISVSLTNILDVMHFQDSFAHQKSLDRFLANLESTFKPTLERPLTIYQTRNTQPPHRFERMNFYDISTRRLELLKNKHTVEMPKQWFRHPE